MINMAHDGNNRRPGHLFTFLARRSQDFILQGVLLE